MEIIFKEEYVNYNEISDANLIDIHNVLLDNNISLELGDNFNNDWAGYSYFYCKSLGELDEKCISSFVYIITFIMTGNPIDINSNFKSDKYYKNDKILIECLKRYNDIIKNDNYSVIELCKTLFEDIYHFYLQYHEKYIKLTERINCVISYKELELLDNIKGNNRSEKIRVLLDLYYNK